MQPLFVLITLIIVTIVFAQIIAFIEYAFDDICITASVMFLLIFAEGMLAMYLVGITR